MAAKHLSSSTGTAFLLKEGSCLKIIDPCGQQVSDLYSASLSDVSDGFSAGRTIDYNDTIFLTKGHVLYGHSGKKHLEIVEDSCGRHDVLVTPCSLQMFQMVNKNNQHHPSCHENLSLALSLFQILPSQITSTFNVFMNVTVDTDGKIKVDVPISKPNDFLIVKACQDLIIGLTACSDEGTNNGKCKPIEYQIF